MAPSTPTSDKSLKSLKRHLEYYHPGGDLAIIVNDILFQVPSFFFTRESPVFKDRLAVKNISETDTKTKVADTGAGPVHTVIIQPEENITPDDLAKFCWIFFNRKFSLYEAPLETWKTILRLSNQWSFPEVKDLAFRELEAPGKFNISLVDRIMLYRQHAAEFKYLEPLYAELLSRPNPLTFEEGEILELRTVVSVAAARETLRANCKEPIPSSAVLKMVRSIFQGGSPPAFGKPTTSDSSPGPIGKDSMSTCSGSGTTTGPDSGAGVAADNINDKGGRRGKAGSAKKKGASSLYDYDDPTEP